MNQALTLRGLSVTALDDQTKLLDEVNLEVPKGQSLGIVGPSGAGKSMFIKAITGFLPTDHYQVTGEVFINGGEQNLLALDQPEQRHQATQAATIIWQDSLSGLNPTQKIGVQLRETLQLHHDYGKAEADVIALEWIERVGINKPQRVARQYPHQLSGGMRQRVSLALGLCGDQPIVFADEPTTALDTVNQQECLTLFQKICSGGQRTLIFSSHDLAVVATLCDHVAVIGAGRIVETGPIAEVFAHPKHEVTRDLIAHVRGLRRGDAGNSQPAERPSND